MINDNMYRLGKESSEIRELFEYGKKRKAEIGEENVFDFSLGNPSVPCHHKVNETLINLLKENDPVSLHGYTSAVGDNKAREAIAAHISSLHGFNVTKNDLYLTTGAAAAIVCALCGIATDGEEVILLAPYFPEYKVFVNRAGATVKEVKCKPDTFEPDINEIEAAINEKTAAIIINSPNNPTGCVYSEESIKAISELLYRKSKELQKQIFLIADEPYRELVYDGVTVPFIPKYYNDTVVCYSYSKSLSLPGERIGYCLISPRMQNYEKVRCAIVGAGRSLGYVCAPSLLQKALPNLLDCTSDIDVYNANRQLLFTNLTKFGYEVVNPKGAFYLFVKSPKNDAKAFSEMAKRHELLIVPSDSFGYPGYVRLSYCISTEQIKKSLPAFLNLAKELGLIGENYEE